MTTETRWLTDILDPHNSKKREPGFFFAEFKIIPVGGIPGLNWSCCFVCLILIKDYWHEWNKEEIFAFLLQFKLRGKLLYAIDYWIRLSHSGLQVHKGLYRRFNLWIFCNPACLNNCGLMQNTSSAEFHDLTQVISQAITTPQMILKLLPVSSIPHLVVFIMTLKSEYFVNWCNSAISNELMIV